jgi:hypothetical protein
MKKQKKTTKGLIHNLRKFNLNDKYRFEICHDNTYKPLIQVRFKGKNVFVLFVTVIAILIIGTTILIAFTPLREFIPGYPNSQTRRNILNNAMKVDSLEMIITSWSSYIDNINMIVSGEKLQINDPKIDSAYRNHTFEDIRTKNDSILRLQVEMEEQFNLSINNDDKRPKDISSLHFFPPIKGVVSSHFGGKTNHLGINIVAEPSALVKSTLDGTVISANWTIETEYVIQIQHQDNIISIYKHNAKLLRQVGEPVKAGDAIAIVGNSGENKTGYYVNFELWYCGTPVDPEQYIIF